MAGPFTFDAGVSFLSARATDEDRPLLGRPGRSGRLTIGWAAPVGTRISATGVYTGAAPVSLVEDGATVEREAFGRLDLRVAQLLPWGTELVAGIDNALDARPEAWPGFSGRQFYLGLNWRGGMQ